MISSKKALNKGVIEEEYEKDGPNLLFSVSRRELLTQNRWIDLTVAFSCLIIVPNSEEYGNKQPFPIVIALSRFGRS